MARTIELHGITKRYGDKLAVNALSLGIDRGSMFGLLGPNGAGKTSSIRMITGILLPDSGTVSLFGSPFARASLRRVGYLPEERGLYRKMPVRLGLQLSGRTDTWLPISPIGLSRAKAPVQVGFHGGDRIRNCVNISAGLNGTLTINLTRSASEKRGYQ